VTVTKIVDFRDGIPAQTYTMFVSAKVSERNENCRFQPTYVRKAIAEKNYQVGEIRRASGISQTRACNSYGGVAG
jgi:hypothetical protein